MVRGGKSGDSGRTTRTTRKKAPLAEPETSDEEVEEVVIAKKTPKTKKNTGCRFRQIVRSLLRVRRKNLGKKKKSKAKN